jgi:hypothetical protein
VAAGGPPGTAYTVYVGTDSPRHRRLGGLAGRHEPRLADAQLRHRLRLAGAGDRRRELTFNSLGWYRFRTTVVAAVELSSFEARGDVGQVVLEWTTAREENHLGFHVWRADGAADGDYVRLTPAERPLAGRSPYSYIDRTAAPGRTYYYRLEALDRAGGRELFGPRAAVALAVPLRLALHPNVPNPFNPSTAIRFDLPARERVRLTIYDIGGHAVRELVASAVMEPGVHSVEWDGRTSGGVEAGSGIYFARLTVGDWSGTRKLLLVK